MGEKIPFDFLSQQLLQAITSEVAATEYLTGVGKLSHDTLQALKQVPRHAFVSPSQAVDAYVNMPQPIGYGQTISQPYIVAIMTELLQVDSQANVLEIGTGSGYQAAVLSRLVKHVFSIERIGALHQAAKERLQKLGYTNITCIHSNGYAGWPDAAPYDGIIVTAASPDIPQQLLDQLRPGGRLVIPVGTPGFSQDLRVVSKNADNSFSQRSVLPVAFVPLYVVDSIEE